MEILRSKVALKQGKEIRVVSFVVRNPNRKILSPNDEPTELTFFVGVGDTIKQSNTIPKTGKILNFKMSAFDNKILYNYLPLTACGEKANPELAQMWTKHDAALSNIERVVEMTEQTKLVAGKYWENENERRNKLPRYIVLIDYPQSPYSVGEVVNCFNDNFEYVPEIEMEFKKYPDVFQKVSHKLADATEKIGILEL